MIAAAASRVTARLGLCLDSGLRDARLIEPDLLWLGIDAHSVRDAARTLRDDLGARFLVTAGVDERSTEDRYGIIHLFSLDADHIFVALDCSVAENDPHIDSITPVIPGAAWS